MSDAVLQILLLLAYLAIGLISVTFPIYAICVTYLKQEKWESEKERRKRIERVKSKISELTGKLGGERDAERITQLREQIEKYRIELKGTELGVQYLTVRGAVGVPIQYLAITIVFAVFGIYFFYEDHWLAVLLCGAISSMFCVFAVFSLYKTITAVEYAALRPARTIEFDIGFLPSFEARKQVKVKEESELRIFAKSEDNIENFTMHLRIPPEIKTIGENINQVVSFTEHPDSTTISYYKRFHPKNIWTGVIFDVVPQKIGKYRIDVIVSGKGVYEQEKELMLNVVKK